MFLAFRHLLSPLAKTEVVYYLKAIYPPQNSIVVRHQIKKSAELSLPLSGTL
ncbi:unnamed protein product [marine sediment metagenome]|uniref:Uncharacterized protein n=1 Tax=marine sediment metagenome TaxID=412755 RepID=X1V674_9ZZZZ